MWFFIFYRARFVLVFLDESILFMFIFREDGPKLLVRCRFIERTKLIAYYTGFKAPMGGTCTWASRRRSIASLISAAPSSLDHGIANVDFCSVPSRAIVYGQVRCIDDMQLKGFHTQWRLASCLPQRTFKLDVVIEPFCGKDQHRTVTTGVYQTNWSTTFHV